MAAVSARTWIEGYCSKQSVQAGESIDIMVSTNPPRPFEIEIFRMGYYGGRGARLMTKLGPFEGKTQPTPTPGEKNLHECRWEPTTRLTIPDDWPSGVYLGRLTTLVDETKEPYWQSYVVFIVRDDRPADILFQCSDNTWQAYNRWPSNYSVYTHPKGTKAPGPTSASIGLTAAKRSSRASSTIRSRSARASSCRFEFPLAYWLEQHGYDVTYCANSDMLSPDRGLKCKACISVGHDEYWDIRQYRQRRADARRGREPAVPFRQHGLLGHAVSRQQRRPAQPHHVPRRPYGGDNDYAAARRSRTARFPSMALTKGL